MDAAAKFDHWVARYVAAWNSNDPAAIGALFTADARYFTAPYRDPWAGRDEIIREWIAIGDRAGDTDFRYQVLTASEDLGIVKGVTRYRSEGLIYHNLWEIRLEGDRCREFVEWWMEPEPGPEPQGDVLPGE